MSRYTFTAYLTVRATLTVDAPGYEDALEQAEGTDLSRKPGDGGWVIDPDLALAHTEIADVEVHGLEQSA